MEMDVLIANNFLKGAECPFCTQSKMEENISELLKMNKILTEREKTFDWLKDKTSLYLDFYLPDYNIAIECQGKQHFETNSYFKHDPLEHRQYQDLLKRQLCEEHNIKILYYADYKYDFPYKVITSQDELLKNILWF